MRLLARREHAERELRRKLTARGFDASEIDETLRQLQQRDWQSDERYAQSLINTRKQRGQGPRRIAMALQQQGVSGDAVAEADVDWQALAESAIEKYLRNKDTADHAVRMKALRHLVQKGFTPATAKTALANYQHRNR
ncbi:regulatory protein [Permianibacter aggregans]|uniref:Regulatory protein RecX n=2 Tax=Permianibacter aggregans TaxID=1510150 RepID=A0A4R6UYX9_9GAMM|nr:regulatory protein [Permianibacter aggregans]